MLTERKPQNWPLRKRLLVFYSLATLCIFAFAETLIILGVPFTEFKGFLASQDQKAIADISAIGDARRGLLEQWVFERRGDLSSIAKDTLLKEELQAILHPNLFAVESEAAARLERLRFYLQMIRESHYGVYSRLEIIDAKNGKILISTRPKEEGKDVSQAAYFSKPISLAVEEAVINELDEGGKTSKVIFSRAIHAPTKGFQASINAVLVVHISMDNIILPLLNPHIGQTGEIVIVDQDARLMAPVRYTTADGLSPQPLAFINPDKPAALAAQGVETVIESSDYRGVQVLAVTRHLRITSELAWGLVVKIDRSEINQPIRHTVIAHCLVLGVALLAGGFLILLITARLTAPFADLSRAAASLASGNFSVRTVSEGCSELQDLSLAFNSMATRLEHWNKDMESEVAKRTKDLAVANDFLLESNAKFFSLVANVPGLIAYLNPENLQYEFVNDAYEKTFGIPREKIMGSHLREILGEENFQITLPYLTEVKHGKSITCEITLAQPSGDRWIEENYSPVLDTEGNVTSIVVLSLDITERKQAEEEKAKLQDQLNQAQKMESVGRLAGGVAHDFNNMLSVILGHAEMAMEGMDANLPLFADLEEIRKAAARSADITRQLLAFARKQTVAPQVIDLNETVAGMLKMLRRLIGEDIDLIWHPGSGLWPIKIDPSQVDQIMANFCVNARDAIPGVGKVTVATDNIFMNEQFAVDGSDFAPGEFVRLTVSDSGHGMDPETLSHIFEPFFTTKGVGDGTGLGLATIYGAVRQNNGFIKAASEPGVGTTFMVYLPRHTGSAVELHTEKTVEPVQRGNETILLAEDEPTILQMTTTMLERLGYTVLVACTPAEAIRYCEEPGRKIHLLLTDVVMPEMNGSDLAKRLLMIQPDMKSLFMSGYTSDIIAKQGILADGLSFLPKPFSQRELAAKVRQALAMQ